MWKIFHKVQMLYTRARESAKTFGHFRRKVIRAGMTEPEKRTHARKLNMARRQLSPGQRRELIYEEIKENPQKSDRQIARELGVSNPTVSNERKKMEQSGDVLKFNSSIGIDGKERPRQVQRKPVSVFNPTPREQKALQEPEIVSKMAESSLM